MEQHIPGIVLKDGLTQPVFDYKRCLFEKVYVETPVDTDGDGRLDLIAVYIRRPLETTQGMRVPAIYVANPYMLECNEDWYVPHDVDRDVSPYPQQHITESEITFDPSTVSFPQPRYPRATVGYADTAPTEEIPLDCISDWYSSSTPVATPPCSAAAWVPGDPRDSTAAVPRRRRRHSRRSSTGSTAAAGPLPT